MLTPFRILAEEQSLTIGVRALSSHSECTHDERRRDERMGLRLPGRTIRDNHRPQDDRGTKGGVHDARECAYSPTRVCLQPEQPRRFCD
jgi:hypothetical protein